MLRFLVLANPRSRTKWLSEYLACGHDLALGCRSVDEFEERLSGSFGSVETGVALGWSLWRDLFPETKFALIRRDPAAIAASFTRLGFEPDWMFLWQQDCALHECARDDSRTALFKFEDLNTLVVRQDLCEWIGVPWNADTDAAFAGNRIEIDMNERVRQMESNRANTLSLYNDVGRRLSLLSQESLESLFS